MPIYEYVCKGCGDEFEALVRPNEAAQCPECGSAELERLLSLPAVHSEATHGLAMRAARKRDAIQGKERMHAQLEYERNHDGHHD